MDEINKKSHLNMSRLDSVTILPPPGLICNITLTKQRYCKKKPWTHYVLEDGLPAIECDHPECVVNEVHLR